MIKRLGGAVAAALLATAGLVALPGTALAAPTDIVVNEVESNGGTPGDWFELYNKGTTPVDLTGWTMLDSDDSHTAYAFPDGTTVAPGGFLVVDEAQFGFGLGAGDSVRIFDAAKTQIAVYSWTAHATVGSWQRTPDGTGTTWIDAVATKGTKNATLATTPTPTPTAPTGPAAAVWPGSPNVATVDAVEQYTGDLSGLDFTPDGTVLWAVNNGASLLYKLDPANGYAPFQGWETGKVLTYADGTGRPDTEGITVGPDGNLYVATERNNADNKVSKLVILQVDPATAKTTAQWDLTSLLPATGANLGLEAIEWVAGTTQAGFLPGVFFVGVEGSGDVYPVLLPAGSGTPQIGKPLPHAQSGVMALDYDPATGQLWAFCDDTCNGVAAVYTISGTTATAGPVYYARPASMPNLNNEGVAMGLCGPSNTRPVVWADDGDTDGHSLRVGTIACTYVAPATPAPSATPTPVPSAQPKLANTGARA